MEPKKTGWVAEFRGLLGRLVAPSQESERTSKLPPDTRHTLCFLVKVGQVDGSFDAIERAFTLQTLREHGHPIEEGDLDAIADETRFRSAAEIVRPLRERPLDLHLHLLRTGALLAAASGRVTSDEHKALRDAAHELEVSREVIDRLVQEAIEARD